MKNIICDLRSCLIFLIMTSISACSPTGSNSIQVEISDLVGLWNSSENINGQTDVIYTRIASNGDIIEYDFDGDEVDQGLNCYQVDSGSVTHIDDNRFLIITDMHENKQFEVELELLDNGHSLKIYFLDNEDPSKTLKSQIWTRESDASILDNEPSCKKS